MEGAWKEMEMRKKKLPIGIENLEKLCSELLFKLGNILAHSRLRYGKGGRGPGKTLLPGHFHEHLKLEILQHCTAFVIVQTYA